MKTQIKFQKIICLVMIIMGALSAVYSLIYLTGSVSYMGIFFDMTKSPIKPLFDGAELYVDIQPFNTTMFYLSIGMILSAVLLYITATNKRRKYYVTNYVATGVCAGYNIVTSIIIMVKNAYYRSVFVNETDFAAWKVLNETDRLANNMRSAYSESTIMFDLCYVVFALVIVASIILVLNLVWKALCNKEEKKLLAGANLEGGSAL
ncbi:MAG: hypothetical protein ACI4MS_05160 [Candidatus Coproplasma sp.]